MKNGEDFFSAVAVLYEERNKKIIEDYAVERSYDRVAVKWGLSKEQVRQIVLRYKVKEGNE